MKKCLVFILILIAVQLKAQNQISYQQPPREIYDLVMAKPIPSVMVDNTGTWMLLMERNAFPEVAELAQPELRIAGLRINPANFAQSRITTVSSMRLKNLASLEEIEIDNLPADVSATGFQWSPSQKKLAFLNIGKSSVDLYVIDVANSSAHKLNTNSLNVVVGGNYTWVDDNTLIYKIVVPNKLQPEKPLSPEGPVVQESINKKVASRTYQDLIKSSYDEKLFEFYASAQLVVNENGIENTIGEPSIYKGFSVSPDKSFLLVQNINFPYSYSVPVSGYAYTVGVLDLRSRIYRKLVSNPSTEGVPIGFDDAPDFPRNFSWRSDKPASITFVKALDGGLGKSISDWRDALMEIEALENETFSDARELFKTNMRFQDVVWGNESICIFYESSYANRKVNMNHYNPTTGEVKLLHTRSTNDLYSDIGDPVTSANQYNKQVLVIEKEKQLILSSDGASAEGNMPLLQSFDINLKETKVLWQCKQPWYEFPVKVISCEPLTLITSRESQKEITNFHLLNLVKQKENDRQLTFFENPYKSLEGVSREKVTYTREDGIKLSGNLYLPANFNPLKDAPLPLLLWAYPMEYKSATDASQIRGSKNAFTRPAYSSPVFWALRGFVVLDNAEMPIVGEEGKEPNDNFIPQLYLNAHAAIKMLADKGIADSNRVAVGGHSYGAFMVANLLAHTNLFKAGIARSGAYNRTLTPFGFQGEERTYWDAPDVYYQMSPFSFADKIKTPLLLIHGDSDNNSGTFPIQSDRLFSAIKGNGGTVRYVSLPYESHGYSAKENILHMLWEMDTWLEKYVKNQTVKNDIIQGN